MKMSICTTESWFSILLLQIYPLNNYYRIDEKMKKLILKKKQGNQTNVIIVTIGIFK